MTDPTSGRQERLLAVSNLQEKKQMSSAISTDPVASEQTRIALVHEATKSSANEFAYYLQPRSIWDLNWIPWIPSVVLF